MAQLELSRRPECGVLTVRGSVADATAAHLIVDALAFVPENEHLVVDVRAVTSMSADASSALRDAIVARGDAAETVVVSHDPRVTVHLVLAGLDRVAPLVDTLEAALTVARIRTGALAATSM